MSAARSLPVKWLRILAASSKGPQRRRQSALPHARSARISVHLQHKHSDTLYLTAVSIELQSVVFYRREAGGLGVGQGRGDGLESSWLMALSAGSFLVYDLSILGCEKSLTTDPTPLFLFSDKMSPRLAWTPQLTNTICLSTATSLGFIAGPLKATRDHSESSKPSPHLPYFCLALLLVETKHSFRGNSKWKTSISFLKKKSVCWN